MNWTYLDSPIVCEECNVVLEEHSGYVGTQYGICDDCLARVTQSNTGLQSDGGDASPKTLICGWCGNHRKGELNDGVRCSCGGNSWLICTLGCLEHEQPAAAKA